MTKTVKIPTGHGAGYREWEHKEHRCPHCGEKDVWGEGDDYYDGPTLLCLSCESSFSLTDWDWDKMRDLDKAAIRGAVAQQGERLVCTQKVEGSIPSGSTCQHR